MMNFLSWSLNLILIWRISLWQMKKDFREPDGATQDYELDEVLNLLFEIDAFLRAHNLKYRTKFPMEQRQREILADKMLESDILY